MLTQGWPLTRDQCFMQISKLLCSLENEKGIVLLCQALPGDDVLLPLLEIRCRHSEYVWRGQLFLTFAVPHPGCISICMESEEEEDPKAR